MYIPVKTLPQVVRSALDEVGYAKADIEVKATDKISVAADITGDGLKAFVIALNVDTGEKEILWGSWGGANLFNAHNAVDMDTKVRPMPPGAVVIKGHTGYGGTSATIYAAPDRLSPKELEAGPSQDLSKAEKIVLNCIGGLISSYRKEEASRHGVNAKLYDVAVQALAQKGLVKLNKAGAVSITTTGKNTREALRKELREMGIF